MRPFGSDDEFLEHEIDTLTRTTVVLLGAQSRPQGVILRFEITLATGLPLLRGEGRVVASRPASQGVDAGLTLRFTRLDARSKALVDRAASVREARARAASVHPPRLDPDPLLPAAPPVPTPTTPTLPQASDAFAQETPPPVPMRPRSVPPPLPSRAVAPPLPVYVAAPAVPAPPSIRPPAARRREELLDRLRQRAKTLSPSDVQSLLASRAKRPRPNEI